MINANHPGLRALLEFEAARNKVQFDYEEVQRLPASSEAFTPRVRIQAVTGGDTRTVALPLGDQMFTYTGPWTDLPADREEGVVLGEHLVAAVNGGRVHLALSLETLFHQADEARAEAQGAPGSSANQVFDSILGKALPIAVANLRQHDWTRQAEAYARMKMDVLDRATTEWRSELSRNENAVEEKTWEIRALVTRSEHLRSALAGFEHSTRTEHRRRALEEHGQLVQMLESGAVLRFGTRDEVLEVDVPPITITWNEFDYLLGPFHVEMGLGEDELRITGLKGAPKIENYCHPHIGSGGRPCLGNAGPLIAKALGTGDIIGALQVVLEFLRSYNAENPYLRLERWDPDWEDDDDRYQSCYDNSALHDCVTCSDDACPYRDGCERRCYENHSTEDCVSCADCSFRENAIEDCRQDRDPWECVQCTQSCPWAGDEESCLFGHEGARCAACPVTDCHKRPKAGTDNDNEGADEEPAEEGGET